MAAPLPTHCTAQGRCAAPPRATYAKISSPTRVFLHEQLHTGIQARSLLSGRVLVTQSNRVLWLEPGDAQQDTAVQQRLTTGLGQSAIAALGPYDVRVGKQGGK